MPEAFICAYSTTAGFRAGVARLGPIISCRPWLLSHYWSGYFLRSAITVRRHRNSWPDGRLRLSLPSVGQHASHCAFPLGVSRTALSARHIPDEWLRVLLAAFSVSPPANTAFTRVLQKYEGRLPGFTCRGICRQPRFDPMGIDAEPFPAHWHKELKMEGAGTDALDKDGNFRLRRSGTISSKAGLRLRCVLGLSRVRTLNLGRCQRR